MYVFFGFVLVKITYLILVAITALGQVLVKCVKVSGKAQYISNDC